MDGAEVPRNRALARDGCGIAQKLRLIEVLSEFGEARVVGSVALDLVVRRDLDVHVLVKEPDLLATAQRIRQRLVEIREIGRVTATDYRSRGGMKLGFRKRSALGQWDIDVWITDRPEATGFELAERLKRVLRPEQRRAIMRIKRAYHRRGLLQDGLSAVIYRAVVAQGVRSAAAFSRLYCRSNYLRRKPL
jgi:hypothetical protein